jgi:hypothetical protein
MRRSTSRSRTSRSNRRARSLCESGRGGRGRSAAETARQRVSGKWLSDTSARIGSPLGVSAQYSRGNRR